MGVEVLALLRIRKNLERFVYLQKPLQVAGFLVVRVVARGQCPMDALDGFELRAGTDAKHLVVINKCLIVGCHVVLSTSTETRYYFIAVNVSIYWLSLTCSRCDSR